jgi:hypothetical protein
MMVAQLNASRFPLPASSFQLPASSFQLPASSFQLPASCFPLPALSSQSDQGFKEMLNSGLARDVAFLLPKIHGPLTEQVEDVRRMLSGLVQSLTPTDDER